MLNIFVKPVVKPVNFASFDLCRKNTFALKLSGNYQFTNFEKALNY